MRARKLRINQGSGSPTSFTTAGFGVLVVVFVVEGGEVEVDMPDLTMNAKVVLEIDRNRPCVVACSSQVFFSWP
jgi:hypothetical protein